jgi:hypothetical protein
MFLTFSSYSGNRRSSLSVERADNVLEVIERQNQRETTNDSSVFFIDDVYVYVQWEEMQSKRHNC